MSENLSTSRIAAALSYLALLENRSDVGPSVELDTCRAALTMVLTWPKAVGTPDWAALDKELNEVLEPMFTDNKRGVPSNVVLRLRRLMRKAGGFQ